MGYRMDEKIRKIRFVIFRKNGLIIDDSPFHPAVIEGVERQAKAMGGGIKVALLTTLMGLIAAVVLQLFYNYIVSKIDSLVNDMEDSSITLMDILTAYNKK